MNCWILNLKAMSCRITDNRKIHVFEEKGRKLTLNNTDRVETVRIKVDGCEINDSSMRCDYMLMVNSKEQDIYIELKGTDLTRAKNQIIATRDRLGVNKTSKAYIVCSRVPKSTDHQIVKRDLKKQTIDVTIDSNQGSYKF